MLTKLKLTTVAFYKAPAADCCLGTGQLMGRQALKKTGTAGWGSTQGTLQHHLWIPTLPCPPTWEYSDCTKRGRFQPGRSRIHSSCSPDVTRCYRRSEGSTILLPLFLSLFRNRWLPPAKSNTLCYHIKLTLFIFNWASLQIKAEMGAISWVDLQQ